MIDLHTHILPNIDDGSPSTEVSAQQLNALLEQGVRKVAFTPHYYGRRHSPAQFLEYRAAAMEELKGIIPSEMEVVLGSELHFTPHLFFPNETLSALTLGETRYILFELPFHNDWTNSLWQKVSDFMFETDCVPIIAHVERYAEIRQHPALLNELTEMGCLIQVNTGSFIEKSTKGFAFALLKHGLVHCLGSDTHNMDERAPHYIDAKNAILEAGYQEQFQRIQENMQAVWSDEAVKIEPAKPVKKILGIYR